MKGGWHRERTLNSGYIYQIYAYLRSQERDYDPLSLHSTGILLHPAVEDGVDEAVVIQGHEIRFATVNLAADSRAIRNELLRLANASPFGNAGETRAKRIHLNCDGTLSGQLSSQPTFSSLALMPTLIMRSCLSKVNTRRKMTVYPRACRFT